MTSRPSTPLLYRLSADAFPPHHSCPFKRFSRLVALPSMKAFLDRHLRLLRAVLDCPHVHVFTLFISYYLVRLIYDLLWLLRAQLDNGAFDCSVAVADWRHLEDSGLHRKMQLHCLPLDFTPDPVLTVDKVLAAVLGCPPTAAQVEWTAWFIGVWIASGCVGNADICQGGPLAPHRLSRQPLMDRLLDYGNAFRGLYQRCIQSEGRPDPLSPRSLFTFRFERTDGSAHRGAICREVLQRYWILNMKALPRVFCRDTLAVRQPLRRPHRWRRHFQPSALPPPPHTEQRPSAAGGIPAPLPHPGDDPLRRPAGR